MPHNVRLDLNEKIVNKVTVFEPISFDSEYFKIGAPILKR